MVLHNCLPGTQRLKQENQEFKDIISYTLRPYHQRRRAL